MNEKNNFALVPRPPSAIEKSQPGAKRILSDMVRETIEMVRQKCDATPLTLSIEGSDGRAITVFKRNTIIPARTSLILPNFIGNGTSIEFTVVQGENILAAMNPLFGKFIIDDISLTAESERQIRVIFDIDANGVLHVSAQDSQTCRQHAVRFKDIRGGLSKDEIERLLNDVEDRKHEQ